MTSYKATQIKKPASETEFEKQIVALFRELLKNPNVKRVGRRGQSQQGVDIVGYRNGKAKNIVGIQCKLKGAGKTLSSTEVRDEVRKALMYEPKLVEYFIVTTAPDDIRLQQLAQRLTQEQERKGRCITIEVWGWQILEDRIDEFETVREAFDPGFSPSIKKINEQLKTIISGQRRQATAKQLAGVAAKLEEAVSQTKLPASYADRVLNEGLLWARGRRGFGEANWPNEIAELGDRVIDGDLSLASIPLRIDALRQAARANADRKSLERAQRFRAGLLSLTPDDDDLLYKALTTDAAGDTNGALRLLRQQNSKDGRSAIFNIVLRTKDAHSALAWVESAGLEITDFTPSCAVNILLKRIEVDQFDRAFTEVAILPSDFFSACPVLHLLKANLILASILPADQKSLVFQGLPLNPKMLQLASDIGSRGKIKEARAHIAQVLSLVDDLSLKAMGEFLPEVDLWLQLEDPNTSRTARVQIEADLHDSARVLRRLRLALAYGVPVNVPALRQSLKERRETGGWTNDERMAAFLLAFNSKDHVELTAFFDEYRDDLFSQEQFSKGVLAGIEAECLARAGRFADARGRLAAHKANLTGDQVHDLHEVIDAVEKGSELELVRRRYESSKKLTDLRLLVGELVARRDYRQLANYAPTLVKETLQVGDFRVALQALFQESRYGELLDLIETLPGLYALHDEFKSLHAWALFNLGRVLEARPIARELFLKRNDPNDRELAINTAIETGDWGYLQAILTHALTQVDQLDVDTLLRLARLAFEVGSPYVDRFRDTALEKSPENPEVLLSAYMLSVARGDEQQDARVHEWFQKAVQLSGPEGPVQSIDIKDIIGRLPRWNQQVDNVDKLLRCAEVPIFVAAHGLRRQPVDMFLGQAIRNSAATNARMQAPIMAFSGARASTDLSGIGRVAFDVTAVLTLEYLGILRDAIDAFDSVTIAPTTLSTLFQERQFLRVSQPSETARAERLQNLTASQQLRLMPEQAKSSRFKHLNIEDELADMLEMAEQEGALVVRSAPVHRVGSLMDETADLTEVASLLTDTHAVLAFLVSLGKVTVSTKVRADPYLRRVDAGWPRACPISEGSTLYLDDLTVTYLDYVGLLEPLTRSVATVLVPNSVGERSKATLQYASLCSETLAAIERMRSTLNLAIEQGKISLSARRPVSKSEDKKSPDITASSLDLISDLSAVEAIIVDDRVLNKEASWNQGVRSVQTASTISVLKALNDRGKLATPALHRAKHQLREAAYCLLPLEENELLDYILSAPIGEGVLVETPELTAIRRNISLAKRADVFLLVESPWLLATQLSILQAIREVWATAGDENEVRPRSDWLLHTLPDFLAWCTNPTDEKQWALACSQSATQIALLLLFLEGNIKRRRQYADWINSRLIEPLRAGRPWLLAQATEVLKTYLAKLLEEKHDN